LDRAALWRAGSRRDACAVGRSAAVIRTGASAAAAVALAALAQAACAQGASSITTAATSARTLALAGIRATPAAVADAAQSNPAALVRLDAASLTLAHGAIAPGVAAQSFAFALPWRGRAVFAAGADVTRADGAPSASALNPGTDATYAARAGVHAALRLPHDFAIGAGVARYASTLAVDAAHGWCADAGLHWQRSGFRAGAALRGWSFADRAATDAHAWSGGVAHAWRAFEVSAQADGARDGEIGGGAGVAWRVARSLEVRAGGHHDKTSGDRFGAGLAAGVAGARVEWGCSFARGGRTENVVGLVLALGPVAHAPPVRAAAQPPPAHTQAVKATPPPVRAQAAPPVRTPAASSPQRQQPSAPAPPRTPEDAASPVPRCWSVVTARFASLEAASTAIFKLRAADLSPGVERRGDGFVVVAARCVSQPDAARLQTRAAGAGVRCALETE
jgi:hypothetical protein